ncbi:MAG: type II toxin-antitoxin system VapC family toxin [Chloroflexota bacterium]|nr:type II toxin-antitoxin system VapC family toxin [Chloroflexota bacterium]
MTYLLDTDICIYLLNGREPQVKRNADLAPRSEIVISTLTMAEMFSGAARSEQPLLTHAKQSAFFMQYSILPFDEDAASVYGRIDGYLKDAGIRIGPVDTQIAAIALANNLILVTHNTRHFNRVPNLTMEDWVVA